MVRTISALAPRTLDPRSPQTASPADSPTPDEERILTLLGLLGGAPLGADHIAAVTGVAGAQRLLATLEHRGWVTSTGGRYRLVRSSSGVAAKFLVAALAGDLIDYVIARTRDRSGPAALADEAEAVQATLRLAELDGREREALELARYLGNGKEASVEVHGIGRLGNGGPFLGGASTQLAPATRLAGAPHALRASQTLLMLIVFVTLLACAGGIIALK